MSIVGPYRRTDVGDVGGGQFTRVEPSGEFLESPNFEALRTRENLANFSYFFVMLELGKLTHPSGDMELPLLFLLRPVWFFWFLCQGYHSWRMGLTKISQIHSQVVGQKIRHWKLTILELPGSQVTKFPPEAQRCKFWSFPAFRWRVVLWMWQSGWDTRPGGFREVVVSFLAEILYFWVRKPENGREIWKGFAWWCSLKM